MDQADTQLKSCPHCAAQMPGDAEFCPACGRPTPEPKDARAKAGTVRENVAGALSYVTFLPAILFLFLAPYRNSRFVHFHSLQCLLFWGAAIIVTVALKVVGLIVFMVPMLGPLLVLIIDVLAALAALFIWLVLIVKALQGEMFQLPWVGEFAEQHAGSTGQNS